MIAEPYATFGEGPQHVRGVEIIGLEEEIPRAALGPYRTPSPALPPTTRYVEVLTAHEGDTFLEMFGRTAAGLVSLAGSPAPRVLHAFGREGLVHALVLERIEGVRLDRIVRGLHARGERMPIAVALAVARALPTLWLRAGTRAFRLGLGDVKLSLRGRVGARPELSSEHARQAVGAALLLLSAPLPYLSPEEIREGPRAHSGMYTLGMLLYEMLAGELPFATQGSPWELMARLANEERPPIEARNPEIPRHLAALVNRAVARRPEDRFASWEELVSCFAAVASSLDPCGPTELAAWLRSLPTALRTVDDRPPDVEALGDWQRLPHSGYTPVLLPERPIATRSVPHVSTFVDQRFVYAGRDQRPMVPHGGLLVDARPVTEAEYERFSISTALVLDEKIGEDPRTQVTFEQAEAYARWAGKRLPTEEEWTALVEALGAETLGVGEVWEWTTTPTPGGHVVCGGRWRDVWDRPPAPGNRSQETTRAADVGFRCVMAKSS